MGKVISASPREQSYLSSRVVYDFWVSFRSIPEFFVGVRYLVIFSVGGIVQNRREIGSVQLCHLLSRSFIEGSAIGWLCDWALRRS